VRLDIRKTGVVKDGDVAMGSKAKVKVVKNKVAPPFRECEFEILYGIGVNTGGELVDLGSEAGLVDKSGAHYSWRGERIGQGRDNAARFFMENPGIADELRGLLVERRKLENARGAATAAPPAASAAA